MTGPAGWVPRPGQVFVKVPGVEPLIPWEAWDALMSGALVQDALSWLSAEDRERVRVALVDAVLPW